MLVFGRRLHTISLSVFRADGLAEPAGETTMLGPTPAVVQSVRGFNVALWRGNDPGYALVSDLNRAEFLDLARRLAGGG